MRDASDRNVNALQVAQVLTCTSQASNSMQTIETYEKYNIVSFRGVPIIATVKGRDESEVRVIGCGAGFRSTRRGGGGGQAGDRRWRPRGHSRGRV